LLPENSIIRTVVVSYTGDGGGPWSACFWIVWRILKDVEVAAPTDGRAFGEASKAHSNAKNGRNFKQTLAFAFFIGMIASGMIFAARNSTLLRRNHRAKGAQAAASQEVGTVDSESGAQCG
jgi:hypothetical protein